MTWNVNGLGHKIKRGLALQQIRRKNPTIALIQEAHLTGTATKALDRWGYKMISHSEFTSGSRGVEILINKRFPVIPNDTWTDPHGRFAALSCQWGGRIYNVVSVYIQPALHASAFADLGRLLLRLPPGELIMGGDFNATMDDTKDREPPHGAGRAGVVMRDFVQALGLLDIWRSKHPDTQQYSFHLGAHRSLSRIDYIFTLSIRLENIGDISYLPRGISDHSPVLLTCTAFHPGRHREYPIYLGYFKTRAIRK